MYAQIMRNLKNTVASQESGGHVLDPFSNDDEDACLELLPLEDELKEI